MSKYKPYRGSTLNWAGEHSWCIYADGFKRAAELLIANIGSTYEINTVIFPILFLCRHYLELTLKEVIGYGGYLNELPGIPPGGHDLQELWNEAKSYISRQMPDVSANELASIETIILEIHSIDPTSEGSRYPVIRKRTANSGRQASFSEDSPYTHINLDELAGKIEVVSGFLHTVTIYLSVAQDLEAQFRADYYAGSY